MNERKKYLEQHEYKIWQGKDGGWYTYLPDIEKKRILKRKSTYKGVEDAVVEYYKGQENNPTVNEVFQEWNDRKLEIGKISPATHLRNQQVFYRHYVEFGKRKMNSITPAEICDFLETQIYEHKLTAKAFSNLKSITKGFLKRARKRRLVPYTVDQMLADLDTSDYDFKKVIKEDYEEVFDDDEMEKMIRYLEENCDLRNLGVLLMFGTGIRVGELVTLKKEDFCGNVIKIRRTETRYQNENGRYIYAVKEFPKSEAGVRNVVIPNDYTWVIKKLLHINPFTEYIFEEDGRRLNTQNIRMRQKRLCKKLGIYHKSPHKIRKTYGTILLDNHVDKCMIMGQMGHADILVTENHYHRNRKSIDTKAHILSEIPEFKAQ